MDLVSFKGGLVSYHDPHIPSVQTPNGVSYDSMPLDAETLQSADVVVLTTNHDAFDMEFIKEHARLIVDLRNMIPEGGENVYKL